jgi:chromosome segregation protein
MLKSLELHGFKSFADRVRFDFAPGVTCVVGPNGSGKSNVVDALKWLLGDQSPKSLRGKEMTDVIFNGSSGRKASPFAEATLTFDNSSRLLPLDLPEVQIGRRLWRNGDSEYLINRSAARLKDVKDLFLGTGSSAYSIIEQGRVDQILQANPTNRRAVFEEAAGVSRYKSRKIDAQRKLERVGQNLLRLTDIVDEVEARLTATRNQAAKAAKYREISQELQTWWHGLAADDYRRLTDEQSRLESQKADVDRRLEELNHEQRMLEQDAAAFDGDMGRVDQKLRETERQSAAARETMAGHVTTLSHQSTRLQELEADVARLQQQQATLHRRVAVIRIEVEQKTEELDGLELESAELQDRLASQRADLARHSEILAAHRQEIERHRVRHRELVEVIDRLRSEIRDAQTKVGAHTAALEQLGQQTRETEAGLLRSRAGCDQQQQIVRQATDRHAESQQALRQSHARRQTLLGAQDAAKATLSENRERRSAAAARKSLLEDLELRQEGLGVGTREILSRAQTSKHPPWDTVIGSVADLLDVDLEHAALLEVALGPRAELIVLTEYQPLLDYLTQGLCQLSGRVGFLAVPEPSSSNGQLFAREAQADQSVDPNPSDMLRLHDLTAHPGIICRADQLVQSERGVRGLAAAVLANAWIVQSLEAAVRLANTVGRGCRFITLQGEALEPDGSLFIGTARSETALVSRKSELRRLKQELHDLDRHIAEQEAALADVSQSLSGADTQLEAATAQHERAREQLAEAKAELISREQDLERLLGEKRQIAQQIDQHEQAVESAHGEVRRAEQRASQAAVEFQEFESHRQNAERLLAETEQHLRDLEDQAAHEELHLAKQSERLHAQREQLARLQDEQRQRQQQSDEADRRLEAAQAKCRQLALHLLNTRAALDEQHVLAERWAAELDRLHQEKADLRDQRGRLTQRESSLRKRRREISDEAHQLELRLREIDQTLANLVERLQEEEQIPLTELAQSEASAYRLYLEEQRGRLIDGREEAAVPALPNHADPALARAENRNDRAGQANVAAPSFDEVRPEIEARVNRLRRKLKLMGAVDIDSLRDLDALEQRFQSLSAQLQDLVEAKAALEDIIRRINLESRRKFAETFQAVRDNFQHLFRKVFGGGEGDIILEDPDDILECGIDIKARPPGKELRSISLLSGGEKTMTAIALIMAIFRTRPSPFCILDEVDAALDEANVERFTSVVQEFQQTAQCVMITHHKRSMTAADVLYGVTMEESGVSKRMSVRFEDVTEDGHIRPKSSAA